MAKIETKVFVRVQYTDGTDENINCNGLKDAEQVSGAFLRSQRVKSIQMVATHENTELIVHDGSNSAA